MEENAIKRVAIYTRKSTEEGLDMEKVFKGQLLDRPAPQDASQVLEGSVRSRGRRKPVKNALVRLIAPKIGQFATTTTDSTGRFVLAGITVTVGAVAIVLIDGLLSHGFLVLFIIIHTNKNVNSFVGIILYIIPTKRRTDFNKCKSCI